MWMTILRLQVVHKHEESQLYLLFKSIIIERDHFLTYKTGKGYK